MEQSSNTPRVPRTLVEGILGEQAARHMETANRIAERDAIRESKHKRINESITTFSHAVFTLALVFGMGIGCLAIWDAVVG